MDSNLQTTSEVYVAPLTIDNVRRHNTAENIKARIQYNDPAHPSFIAGAFASMAFFFRDKSDKHWEDS